MKKTIWEMPPDVLAVHREIEQWRRNRKKRGPVPEAIWSSAKELAKRYTIHRVSVALGLNYGRLKEQIAGITTKGSNESTVCQFVEIKDSGTPKASGKHSDLAQVSIEVSDGRGAQMSVRLTGGKSVELTDLLQTFWCRER